MDYKERSLRTDREAKQAYRNAQKQPTQPQPLRIGGRVGATGRYQVLSADGGITSQGDKTFNGVIPADGFVRGVDSSKGAVALDHRNYKAIERRRVVDDEIEELPPTSGKLILIGVTSGALQEGFSSILFEQDDLLTYNYNPETLEFEGKSEFKEDAVPDSNNGAGFLVDLQGDNNFISFQSSLSAPENYFAEFGVQFDGKIAENLAELVGDIGAATTISYRGASFLTAPIEIDMSINGVTLFPSLFINLNKSLFFADCQLFSGVSSVIFRFRYRKRGAENWFDMA